jgi:hypothetical protein
MINGTGNTTDPFVVSLNLQQYEWGLGEDGPIDISVTHPGAFVVLALAGNASAITLPSNAGDWINLLIRQDGTGNTITWPPNVLWPGGSAPVLSTTPGHSDWIEIRRVGDYWVGRLVAAEIG